MRLTSASVVPAVTISKEKETATGAQNLAEYASRYPAQCVLELARQNEEIRTAINHPKLTAGLESLDFKNLTVNPGLGFAGADFLAMVDSVATDLQSWMRMYSTFAGMLSCDSRAAVLLQHHFDTNLKLRILRDYGMKMYEVEIALSVAKSSVVKLVATLQEFTHVRKSLPSMLDLVVKIGDPELEAFSQKLAFTYKVGDFSDLEYLQHSITRAYLLGRIECCSTTPRDIPCTLR